MKSSFVIFCFLLSVCSNAQSKKFIQVLNNTESLERAVFESKDSLVLEKLFAKNLAFIQPDGKIESKSEAIKTIVGNKSFYSSGVRPSGYNTKEKEDSIIVRHIFTSKEKKPDNTEELLSLSIETVWAKENGEWKLFRCQLSNL